MNDYKTHNQVFVSIILLDYSNELSKYRSLEIRFVAFSLSSTFQSS